MIHRPTARALALCLLSLSALNCGTGSPALTIPAAEAAAAFKSLAIVLEDSEEQAMRPLLLDIRTRAEELPGSVMPESVTSECAPTESKSGASTPLAVDPNSPSFSPNAATVAVLDCLVSKGATSALFASLRSIQATHNTGVVFFCGGSQSIRPKRTNPHSRIEPTRSRGSVTSICLDVSVYRLPSKRIYIAEAPFAPLMRLEPNSVSEFVQIPITDSLADPALRAKAIDLSMGPLLKAAR